MACKIFLPDAKVPGCLISPGFPGRGMPGESPESCGWGQIAFSSSAVSDHVLSQETGIVSPIPSRLLTVDIPTSIRFPWGTTLKWCLCCYKRAEHLACVLSLQINFIPFLPKLSMSPDSCLYQKNFSTALIHSLESWDISSKHTFPEISGDTVWGTVE